MQGSVAYKLRAAMLGAVMVGIWGLRNQKVFQDKHCNVDSLCKEIARDMLIRIRYKLKSKTNRFLKSVISRLERI